MRKPLFFSLLGGIALAYSFASSPAEAETVKLNKGRFIVVINPTAVNGQPLPALKHPLWAIGLVYRNAAGGFVFAGKKSPHLTGTISGTSFRAHNEKGVTLEGKLSSNEKVAAVTGKFTQQVSSANAANSANGKATITGSFALVPITTAGGQLMGGGPSVSNALPNGWGSKGMQGVGAGIGEWGYQGGGLFSDTEKPNLSGTTVSGDNSWGWDIMSTAYDYWAQKAKDVFTPKADGSGSYGSGNAAKDFVTAMELGAKGEYTGDLNGGPAPDSNRTVLDHESQDERQTYGGGTTLNGGLVLKGQDGGGNGLEWPAASGGDLKPVAPKGDNPFEVSSADQLNLSKLFNGASDPSPGTK